MKNLLIAGIFLFTTVSLSAQTHLMFKIGGNFDFTEFRRTDKSDVKIELDKFVGAHFGMSLDVPLYEDILSFSPDLQFLVRTSIGKVNSQLNADIQIPLTFSCYILPTFGVDLGPSIHYKVLNLVDGVDGLTTIDNGFEKLDFGVAGGVRFKLNDNLMLVGRYYLGLRKTFEGNFGTGTYGTYNHSGQISFLYTGGRY